MCEYVTKKGVKCSVAGDVGFAPLCMRHAKLKIMREQYGITDEMLDQVREERKSGVIEDTSARSSPPRKKREKKAKDPLDFNASDLPVKVPKSRLDEAEEEASLVDREVRKATAKIKAKKKVLTFVDTDDVNGSLPPIPSADDPNADSKLEDAFDSMLFAEPSDEPEAASSKRNKKAPKKKSRIEPDEDTLVDAEGDVDSMMGDVDSMMDDDMPRERHRADPTAQLLMMGGYRALCGIAEVYCSPRLDGFTADIFQTPGIDDVLQECAEEVEDMLGIGELDCWSRLGLITLMAAGVRFARNSSIGSGASIPTAPLPIRTDRKPVNVVIGEEYSDL